MIMKARFVVTVSFLPCPVEKSLIFAGHIIRNTGTPAQSANQERLLELPLSSDLSPLTGCFFFFLFQHSCAPLMNRLTHICTILDFLHCACETSHQIRTLVAFRVIWVVQISGFHFDSEFITVSRPYVTMATERVCLRTFGRKKKKLCQDLIFGIFKRGLHAVIWKRESSALFSSVEV